MKATVRDPQTLRDIGLFDVFSYLRAGGWTEHAEPKGRTMIWVHRTPDGEEVEVALPRAPGMKDYAIRLSEVLKVLEEVEERSQLEILRDLSLASADVIRVRHMASNGDSTIQLQNGVLLVQHARDLMYSAATAAVSPRRVLASRRPLQAIEYMRAIRLGQTEQGSFVVTLISPVSPLLSSVPRPELADVVEPFPRAVTHTLARALAAIQTATAEAAATGRFDAFERATPAGVSANLCDSIAGLSGTDDAAHDVAIGISWAASRPVLEPAFRQTQFTSDAVAIIREAARMFRETEPLEGVAIIGVVVNLFRNTEDAEGVATVTALVEGRARQLVVYLRPPEYELAIDAHRTKAALSFEADVVREGRTFRALNVRDLQLVPSP